MHRSVYHKVKDELSVYLKAKIPSCIPKNKLILHLSTYDLTSSS